MTSSASGRRRKQPLERAGSVKVGVAAAEEDRLDPRRERVALELELGEQRVDVAPVIAAPADDRDEVAVAAPVRAERQVNVEVARSVHVRS